VAVLNVLSVALEVPDLDVGKKFYTDAGLDAVSDGELVHLRCAGQRRDSILLIKTEGPKRLHHLTLRADDLEGIEARVPDHGGIVLREAHKFEKDSGLWIQDPHGMRIHLFETDPDPDLAVAPTFEINAPGRRVRTRRSAILPRCQYARVKPQRLGHVVVFTPDVPRSVRFMTEALGMGLADKVGDALAFCCARENSDHHVVAFAKSAATGFHHASFQVSDPDQVGRGGRALVESTGKGDWGFGRHTIGSNFFHYVQDPWGSWLEYYSDMDFIDDYAKWKPTNYGPEDALASWGPPVPHDFIHNYEAGPLQWNRDAPLERQRDAPTTGQNASRGGERR
jgi:catechol 2,3-dioxygenase-like lactoylglutathione lyase family enzyme